MLAPIAHARGPAAGHRPGQRRAGRPGAWGLPREPLPQEKLAAGCDVVTFSGDKLLGGPQAGLIVGSRAAIGPHPQVPDEARAAHEQAAAGRAGGHADALPAPRTPGAGPAHAAPADAAGRGHPCAGRPACSRRGRRPWRRASREVVDLLGQIGSGSLPVERLPSAGLAIAPAQKKGAGRALDELATALRGCPCRSSAAFRRPAAAGPALPGRRATPPMGCRCWPSTTARPTPHRARFITEPGLGLPVLRDTDGAAAKAFGVRIFPTTVAIARNGRAAFSVVGEVDWGRARRASGCRCSDLIDCRCWHLTPVPPSDTPQETTA
jgi:hypothetical protein